MKLEIDMQTKIGVSKAISSGLSQTKLPQTVIIGGSSGNGANSGNPLDMLIQLLTVEKAKSMTAAE